MAKSPRASVVIEAVNNTKGGLNSATKSVRGFANNVSGAMKGLLAGAAALAVGNLFKSAVQEATDAQGELAQLKQSLANIGGGAENAAPQVMDLANNLALLTGKDGGEITTAFANLAAMTGDYEQSMAGLPTVLDVAKARQLSLKSASDLVGKALNGNVSSLTELGVVAGDGETAFDALRRSYAGFAAAEGKTFAGTLGRIREAWNNVKEAIGNAILGNDSFSGSANGLIAKLGQVQQWIEANEQSISGLVGAIFKFIEYAGQFGGLLIQGFFKAKQGIERFVTDVVINFYEMGPKTRGAFGQILVNIGEFVGQANGLLNKFGIHIGDGLVQSIQDTGARMLSEATIQLGYLEEARKESYAEIDAKPEKTTTAPTSSPVVAVSTASVGDKAKTKEPKSTKTEKAAKEEDAVIKDIELQSKLLELEDKRAGALSTLMELERQNHAIAQDHNATMEERLLALDRERAATEALADARSAQAEEADKADEDAKAHQDDLNKLVDNYGSTWNDTWNAIGSGQNAFDVVANKGRKAISDLAKSEASEQLAKGVGKLAEGTWPPNPVALASAGKHFAAAALFSALAGAGGGGARGGGGGAGSQGTTSSNATSIDDGSQGTATVIVKGRWRPNDPAFIDELATALNAAKGRRVDIRVDN